MIDREQDALQGIRLNVERAKTLCDGLTLEQLKGDWAKFYALTRCLEIISEAARRLSADIENRHPAVPWKAIRAAGNIYRHVYSRVLEERILATVQLDLDDLYAAVVAELEAKP